MISIQTKYIILFWIIILILFTFYCVIRLGYLREKYDNVLLQKIQTTKPNVIVQLYNEYMPNDPIHVLSSQIKEDTNLYSTCYPKHINVIDNTKLIA